MLGWFGNVANNYPTIYIYTYENEPKRWGYDMIFHINSAEFLSTMIYICWNLRHSMNLAMVLSNLTILFGYFDVEAKFVWDRIIVAKSCDQPYHKPRVFISEKLLGFSCNFWDFRCFGVFVFHRGAGWYRLGNMFRQHFTSSAPERKSAGFFYVETSSILW